MGMNVFEALIHVVALCPLSQLRESGPSGELTSNDVFTF